MVHPYLSRRKGDEPVAYPHPSLEPVLKRTLGVPLFQEQLLRIAMVAADFSGGEAEELRRAMGFKRSEERMRKIEVKLRAGMARNGIVGDAAESILLAIRRLRCMAFPSRTPRASRSSSMRARISRSIFRRRSTPRMLNNQPMGFYHPATLVKDAQRHGVRFMPIDVQQSRWDCAVDGEGAIRLGLRYVQGLREDVGRAIESGGATWAAVKCQRRAPRAERRAACPKCGSDDERMIERDAYDGTSFCNLCAHAFDARSRVAPSCVTPPSPRLRGEGVGEGRKGSPPLAGRGRG